MKNKIFVLLMLISLNALSQNCLQNTNSVLFNGTSSVVSIGSDNNLQITDSITIEAWIYPTSWAISPFQGTIFCKHSWSVGGEKGYVFRAGGSGQLSFNLAGVDSNGAILSWQDLVSPVNTLSLNTWTHVAGTFDGDSMRLFVNGVQITSKYMHGSIVISDSFNAKIGKICDTGVGQTRYWIGNLDEIRVWHRALGAAELTAQMSKHIDPTTANNLVGYWRFNEGAGPIAADLSTSGNDGGLVGATWATIVPFTITSIPRTIVPNGLILTCIPPGLSYQWIFNSTLITNATQQSYTATQNGNYAVTVVDSNGCSLIAGPYTVTGVVGILEFENNVKVNIVNRDGKLMISFEDGSIIKTASLFKVDGALVQSINNSNKISFETNNLSKGIYVLQLSTDKGNFSKNIYLGN